VRSLDKAMEKLDARLAAATAEIEKQRKRRERAARRRRRTPTNASTRGGNPATPAAAVVAAVHEMPAPAVMALAAPSAGVAAEGISPR
jgi:hypothetical protein